MSHWRSGWKFWPEPPQGPVDDAYHQVQWIRPYRIGFPRVAAVLGLGLVVSQVAVVGVVALLGAGGPLLDRLLVATAALLVAFGLGVLVARIYASGVYVNDHGLRLVTARRTLTVPWSEVVDVSEVSGRLGVLGLPLPAARGRAVVLTLRDLGPVRTQVTSVGADFLGRPEAYAMASGSVERWWRATGPAG